LEELYKASSCATTGIQRDVCRNGAIASVLRHTTQLTYLNLQDCSMVSAKALTSLDQLPNLVDLNLADCKALSLAAFESLQVVHPPMSFRDMKVLLILAIEFVSFDF
jgi:hypothetical protein